MRSTLVCARCGTTAAKWVGKCASCGAWGSLIEPGTTGPIPLGEVDATANVCRPTGIGELDRVLGGGFVPGSTTLLGGEPGIGKSTLLLQALLSQAAAGARCLLVCAEESPAQVKLRAVRLGPVPEALLVLPETSLPAIVAAVEATTPDVCVIDSIQMVNDPETGPTAGSVTQVRDCSQALSSLARRTGTAMVLVGHVTKDGGLAGPRALEHLVDTVLSFDGDRHHALRLLSAVKHRFGPTGELGVFEMTETGMEGIADPSRLLLGDRRRHTAGSTVVISMEGRRPIAAEIQSLLGNVAATSPRRSAQGVDGRRLAQILAVLERRCELMTLATLEVFVSAVGGMRLVEPAADLGVALAVASCALGIPMPDDLVAFGEVGLAGELRQVPHAERRLAEARRLGFTRAIVPHASPAGPDGLHLVRAGTLGDAVNLLRRRGAPTAASARPGRPQLAPVG